MIPLFTYVALALNQSKSIYSTSSSLLASAPLCISFPWLSSWLNASGANLCNFASLSASFADAGASLATLPRLSISSFMRLISAFSLSFRSLGEPSRSAVSASVGSRIQPSPNTADNPASASLRRRLNSPVLRCSNHFEAASLRKYLCTAGKSCHFSVHSRRMR